MSAAMHTNELKLISSRFTPRAARVFRYARDEAAEHGAPAIGTLHLVSAFARDGHGLLVRVFAASHVSLTALGQETGTVSAASGKPLVSGEATPDEELDRVLQFAADEAHNLSRPLISTEHLLLGILRAEDSAAGKLLHQKGMRLDATRAQVAALTARRPEPSVEHRRPRTPTGDRPSTTLTVAQVRAAHGRLPIVLRETKPRYSPAAVQRNVEGTVLLEAVVLPDGWADGITVVQSLDPELDKRAVAALEQWQFAPATIEGRPVPVIITCELKFTLR
jgi:TonB family protein